MAGKTIIHIPRGQLCGSSAQGQVAVSSAGWFRCCVLDGRLFSKIWRWDGRAALQAVSDCRKLASCVSFNDRSKNRVLSEAGTFRKRENTDWRKRAARQLLCPYRLATVASRRRAKDYQKVTPRLF
jgi:hypothetical protein